MGSASERLIDNWASRMERAMARFRRANPLPRGEWPAGMYMLPIRLDGRPGTKTLIWYESPGCAWSRKAGCTMCNFGMRNDTPSPDAVVESFVAQIGRLDPGTRFLHLGPGGSVFHLTELSLAARG